MIEDMKLEEITVANIITEMLLAGADKSKLELELPDGTVVVMRIEVDILEDD